MEIANRNTSPLLLVSTIALGGLALPAHAAVWETVPEVGIFTGTIDNARLDTTGLDESSSRAVVDARVRANATGQRGFFRIEPRVRADIYGDAVDNDLDSTDLFLRSNGEYRWSGAAVGYAADVRSESILRSEIQDAIPNDPDAIEPPGTDPGSLVQFNESRDRAIIAPFASFTLSPRSNLLLESAFTKVSYSGPPVASRTPFDALDLSLGIVRRVDERNRVTARVFTSSFEADLTVNSTDTVGVQGEYQRQLSDLWGMTLFAGVQRSDFIFTDSNNEIVDNAAAEPNYGIRFRRRGERTNMNFSLARQLEPNASGFLVERDQLRFFVSRRFTQRFGGQFGARFYQTSSLADVNISGDRNDSRIEARLEWYVAERWFVVGGYNYATRKFEGEPKADSNELYLGINYRGLSRER